MAQEGPDNVGTAASEGEDRLAVTLALGVLAILETPWTLVVADAGQTESMTPRPGTT
jgi:hypothetical protein